MPNPDITKDLTQGIAISELGGGAIVRGKVGDEEVVVLQRGADVLALGAHCTHYRGPLADGLVVGDTIRCPWHHACFDLRTGEPVRAPALDPLACWRVERDGNTVFVREKLPPASKKRVEADDMAKWPDSIVIVGGGAAGFAAADMLRREGYDRPLTMVSADEAPPCDRPNLSKDYLAGSAQEDWIPLRSDDFYADERIDLILKAQVSALDLGKRRIQLADGRTYPFGSLLLATGAEPIRLNVPGSNQPHVHYL